MSTLPPPIKSPCPESASELYRSSDRILSEKLVPTFADRGCHVVSVTDLYCRILGFLDRTSKPVPYDSSQIWTLPYFAWYSHSLNYILCSGLCWLCTECKTTSYRIFRGFLNCLLVKNTDSIFKFLTLHLICHYILIILLRLKSTHPGLAGWAESWGGTR
jgi:hypothetical protein